MRAIEYIEFHDKVALTESMNLSEMIPNLRKLIQYRKEISRRIIETNFDNTAYIELFKLNGEEIKRYLGL